MPYTAPPVHDVVYTTPPGWMSFTEDWGLDPIYDETNNPSPIQRLIFSAATVFTTPAWDVSFGRGEARHFNAGYIWLKRRNALSDGFFEEIRYPFQYFFMHRFIDIRPFSEAGFRDDSFDEIKLSFNSARIQSVRLVAYPPPTWVDP